METQRTSSSSSAIGFCLLPSELIQKILLSLALPEIIQLKLLNKSIATMISDQCFKREYNSQTLSTTWLFVYKKRWHRDIVLDCFTDRSDRWFRIQIGHLLKPVICPGESIYLLTASGNFLLFASNTTKEVIAVNLVSKTVQKLPPSPLGPRGTSSWRRSGMKLVAGLDHFRFMFAELVEDCLVLFIYNSETNTWRSVEAREELDGLSCFGRGDCDCVFLNVINGTHENMVIAFGLDCENPIIIRPRFVGRENNEQQLTVGFSWGNVIDRLHVYGDGYMLVVKSNDANEVNLGVRMLNEIELWTIGKNGRKWEYISKVPCKILGKIKRPYWVMMGCLEKREGVIRIVLLSNFQTLWDLIWLSYDIERSYWNLVSVPQCNMKGLNMAGVAFSSGLTLP